MATDDSSGDDAAATDQDAVVWPGPDLEGPTDGQMTLEVSTLQDWTVITVTGELDVATAPDLSEAIAAVVDGGAHQLIIDLDGLRFMDSSGLNVLVGAQRGLGPDGSLRLVAARSHTRKVFAISGLDRLISLFDTVAAASGEAPLPSSSD